MQSHGLNGDGYPCEGTPHDHVNAELHRQLRSAQLTVASLRHRLDAAETAHQEAEREATALRHRLQASRDNADALEHDVKRLRQLLSMGLGAVGMC